MTDIIKLAREAGATPYTNRHYPGRPTHTFNVEQLERFAELVAAPLKAEIEMLRKEIDEHPIRSFCAPAYATLDLVTMGRNDPMYADALELIEKHQKYSVSLVQRHLRISYNRASFMVDHAKEDAARAKEQT